MPTYIMLTTLTSEGAHTVHANPDRLTALADEVAKFGCKVVAEYAVLGQYDFVTVVEAPDNETVAHLSVDLGSRGTARTQTLPAISLDAAHHEAEGSRPARPVAESPSTRSARRPEPGRPPPDGAVSVAVRAGLRGVATSRARTAASAGSSKWFTGLSVRLKWWHSILAQARTVRS
jgi:uncharacterized protein with GYD domain